jgi:hypothetical protein
MLAPADFRRRLPKCRPSRRKSWPRVLLAFHQRAAKNRQLSSERSAARDLLVTPATLPWMIWQKWEVLDDYLDTEKRDGVFSDNRTIVALACVKADLMRFRIIEEAS